MYKINDFIEDAEKLGIGVEREKKRELKVVAAKQNKSMSGLLRKLIDEEIERWKVKDDAE